ncbi:MAG: LacI family transcriptional regulator [Chloroflexi bacterium]|nr:LacI family transcriptional regulator [Chloroflexota bacterium]
MPDRATIADVAARAGVSTATVSRVLSGPGSARAPTRERVLAAARELDYRPSGIARALKRRETRTLGLLVTDLGNPFYPQVVRAVESAAHERGYGIVLGNGEDDPQREMQHLDLLVERRVDGIIVASSRMTGRHAAFLNRSPVPIVLVNSTAAGSGLPAVATAHRRGTEMAATHLVELGHRRIAHIGAPSEHSAAAEREAGVRDALVGLPDPVVVQGDGHVEGGALAAESLLGSGVTAIACYNDLTAIGALRTLRRAGSHVPQDVSVVGFDDIEMAAWTDPPLTTIRQPTGELGRWAVARLLSALDGTESNALEPRELEPELVVRGSTGPPPA